MISELNMPKHRSLSFSNWDSSLLAKGFWSLWIKNPWFTRMDRIGQRLLRMGADWKPLVSKDDGGHDFIPRDQKFLQINVQAIKCHLNS